MVIPLDPGSGGRSIGTSALANGDIIVSTTGAAISDAIRAVTDSSVSHAILYIGGQQVVEAIKSGVELRTLATAIKDATLAVAYRKPGLSSVQALRVRDFAGMHLGKGYDYTGILGQAGFQLDRRVLCDADIRCIRRAGNNNMWMERKDRFFCSELVLAAFKYGGVPLNQKPPSWSSPDDVPRLHISGVLEYVGHLKV